MDCILFILRVPHSKRTKESLILSVILSEKEMCEQATGWGIKEDVWQEDLKLRPPVWQLTYI